MAPSFDCVASSLLCAEDNNGIFYDDDDYGLVDDFEATWHHQRNHEPSNQNLSSYSEECLKGLPLQSDECLALMVERECEHLPENGYLERLRNGGVDLGARQEVVDWIGKKGKAWMMQLLAVACLSLAAKTEETEIPLRIDFLEFKPSEIAAAVAMSVAGETQTVDTEKAISALTQHVQKEKVLKCVKLIHELSLLSESVKGLSASVPSVPQSPIGVLDAACLSYKTDDAAVGSCVNSSHNSPDTKRRKLNRPCEVEL
ncbi:hypothetical protein RJ640_023482 [Escallonia rubra]|uniref:Cyclin C-terminal domain-containing protein n=1 Tax=Escallonia rubra TaxID=112253 RepID=A0AA88UNY3_9ASTE|nr:hypothetical protein RJ640_023482 [Escallonia rubra]